MSPEKKKTTKKTKTTTTAKKKKEEKTPVKTKKVDTETKQNIFEPKIEKITINIGVGEAGERLTKAETVLKGLTGHISVKTLSKTTNKDWGLRKRMPLGCKVTLRGKDANNFLTEALKTRENKISDYSFDEQGNLSFGIPDHTLFKNQKYDPKIGIFGMDVSITMERAGYRVKKRRIAPGHIPKRHQVKKEDTMQFFKKQFNVEVLE
jgi:large subunit ribosomal protein L5